MNDEQGKIKIVYLSQATKRLNAAPCSTQRWASASCMASNSFIWLRDFLQRIATHPINKIDELLSHNWKTTVNG